MSVSVRCSVCVICVCMRNGLSKLECVFVSVCLAVYVFGDFLPVCVSACCV